MIYLGPHWEGFLGSDPSQFSAVWHEADRSYRADIALIQGFDRPNIVERRCEFPKYRPFRKLA